MFNHYRQQVPLLIKSLMTREQHRDVHEIVIANLELKTQIDPPWLGKVKALVCMY